MEFLIAAVVLWVFFKIMVAWVRACCRVGDTLGKAIVNASQPRERCALAEPVSEETVSATAK